MLAAFDRAVAAIFDNAFNKNLESRSLASLRDSVLPNLLSRKKHALLTKDLGARTRNASAENG